MERNKQPVTLLIADTHLSEHTIDQNLSVFTQVCELCKQLDIGTFVHLGDIFTSRKGQPEIVLNTFKAILDKLKSEDLIMLTIDGNHDKTDGTSESSFLEAFNGGSSMTLMPAGSVCEIDNIRLIFLPYFDEHLAYPSRLEEINGELKDDKINMLLTHCAIDGVTNNSGLKVKGELPIGGFDRFRNVFVGHYHNRQTFDNIVYTGSTDPRNFGEDDQKGCTVIYDDGSYEFINFDFKPYITIDLLASDLTLDVVSKVKRKSEEAHLRFRVQGEVGEQLKPLVAQLDRDGVKVEIHKDLSIDLKQVQGSQVSFTSSDIIESYLSWSDDRKIENKEFGELLLRDVL